VNSEPRAFIAVDRGTATIAVSLIGHAAGRWRLIGATSGPAGVPAERLVERLRARLVAADADLAAAVGLQAPGSADDLPQVACATSPPPEMAVVAATRRALTPLVAAATSAGWRVRPLALDGAEILTVAGALADPSITAVLAGSGEPPGGDERPLIPDLVTIIAAAAQRRPDLDTVLVGGLAEPGGGWRRRCRRPAGRHDDGAVAREGRRVALRILLDSLRGDGRTGAARWRPRPRRSRRSSAGGSRSSRSANRPVPRRRAPPRAGSTAAVDPPRRRARSSPTPRSCREGSATRTSTPSSAGSASRSTASASGSAARAGPRAVGRRGRRRRVAAWPPRGPPSSASSRPRRRSMPFPARSRHRRGARSVAPAAGSRWRPPT
jgi:hypothetical protein